MESFSRLVLALLASAPLSVSAAEPTSPVAADVPVSFAYGVEPSVKMRVLGAASKLLGNQHKEVMRAEGLVLQTVLLDIPDGICFVEVGLTLPSPANKMERLAEYSAWAASKKARYSEGGEACEVSFQTALSYLINDNFLGAESIRTTKSRTRDPKKPIFRDAPRQPDTVTHYSFGLSEAGERRVAGSLGDRWTVPLDHRKFALFQLMRNGKTVEGYDYCLLLAGLTATAPDGVNPRLPSSYEAAVAPACTIALQDEVLYKKVRTSYERDLVEFMKFNVEYGQTYPSIADIKNAVKAVDRARAASLRN
jgi:hypothetical protein